MTVVRASAKSPLRRPPKKTKLFLSGASVLSGGARSGTRSRPGSGSIELTRLNERLTAQLAAFRRIVKTPALVLGQLHEACGVIAETTAATLSASRVCLWRYNETQNTLDALYLLAGGNCMDPAGVTLSANRHPRFFAALERDRDVVTDDARNDAPTNELADGNLLRCGVTSMFAAPIRAGGRLVGALSIEHTGPRRIWALDERRFANAMADLAGSAFDAAERESVRAAAIKAKADADAASEAKTNFLSNMSHELRTPLNAIIGFSEIMSEQAFGPLLPRYHGYAADIHRSAAHLLHIINDVLDIARIESGKMTLYEEPVDLGALVEISLAFVRERAAKKAITLDAQVPAIPIIIHADDSRLRQIMLNLLSNAVKFTPQDGRVWITIARGEDDRACVTVGDTGIGMHPEEIPHALEPFRQVGGMVARTQEGSGLGLPISKKLAALHGASFEIESADGRGTIVTMAFPRERTLGS